MKIINKKIAKNKIYMIFFIKKLKEKKVLQQVDKLTLKVNPNLIHILKHDSLNINFE